MATPKQEMLDIGSVKWSTLALDRGDQDTSFECPSCGARSRFSHSEASRKNPKATGQLRPVDQTVTLTSAIFFDHIYDRQPLIRGLSLVIGIATAIVLILFWQETIWEGGSVPWWAGALALFGGWAVMQLVQHAMSPRLPLWRFNCAECGAEYVLATNGTQGRIGDHKGRIAESSTPEDQMHPPGEKSPKVEVAKVPVPEPPPLRVRRKAVKAMAANRDVEQLVKVAQRGGLVAQLTAGKALLELDDVGGLDALLNETDLGKYYERVALRLEAHQTEPRAIEALRRAVSHEGELNKVRGTTAALAAELNKVRHKAAAEALERLGTAQVSSRN